MGSSPRSQHLLLVAALATLGCRTPSSKIPLESLTADEQAQPDGEAREVLEPLPVERPTDLLPAEVAVLAEAIDPAMVLALVDPLDKYPEFGNARAELRGQLGADPLDPEQWDELGFDVHGPAGIGVLDLACEAWFAYASLVDEAKLEQTLERFADMIGAREEYSAMDVGPARVFRLGRKASVIVRERVAMLVVVDDPEDAPRDYVVSVATIDPRESLGRSERFAWAREQLVAADDGFVFVSPVDLFAQIDRERRTDSDYGLRYAEEQLARARAVGDPPEVIREYEARVEQERTWQREREGRDKAERELRDALLGSLGSFVGAADLRRDGIVGHGRVLMPGSSLLRRLFVAPERESPLLAALADAPLFALDGRVDLQVMLELVELLARAEGQTLEAVNRELLAETGIDVIAGLIPALSGAGGITMIQTGKPDPKRLGEVGKTLGVAGYAGLRDPEQVRKLLDQVARDKAMGGALVSAKRGDGWVLEVPQWHDVSLAIVGDNLIVSTDQKLTTRVRNAERGGLAETLTPEHPLRGPIQSPALRMYGRFAGAVLVDVHEPWKQNAEDMLYDFNTHHVLTPDEAAKVPRSRDYKRKLAELEKAVAELNEYNRRRAQQEFERQLGFAEQLGDAGWQLEPVADGLGLAGQWRFAAGMTPLEVGYKLLMFGDAYDWSEYERINNQAYQLVDELRMIRQADLDAAAAKRSK